MARLFVCFGLFLLRCCSIPAAYIANRRQTPTLVLHLHTSVRSRSTKQTIETNSRAETIETNEATIEREHLWRTANRRALAVRRRRIARLRQVRLVSLRQHVELRRAMWRVILLFAASFEPREYKLLSRYQFERLHERAHRHEKLRLSRTKKTTTTRETSNQSRISRPSTVVRSLIPATAQPVVSDRIPTRASAAARARRTAPTAQTPAP